MDALLTCANLNEEELKPLPSDVVEKLVITFDSISHEAKELSESFDRIKSEKEGKLDHLEKKYQAEYEDKEDFRKRLDNTLSINNELSITIRNLENDSKILNDQLKRNLAELEESYEEAQETRLKEELESLQRHNSWLDERFKTTTDQLLTIRRELLELALSSKASLKTNQQTKVEQLCSNEEQAKEAEEKNLELQNTVTSMQSMLKAAFENISKLEEEKKSLELASENDRANLDHRIQTLESDLERSQALLEKFRVQ
ncbi:unnamed protein product, partial [Protopolystoma xenopodis]